MQPRASISSFFFNLVFWLFIFIQRILKFGPNCFVQKMEELRGKEATLFFYLTTDDNGHGILQPVRAFDNIPDASSMATNESIKYLGLSSIHGHTNKLGDFVVSFHSVPDDHSQVVHTAYLSTVVASPHLVKEAVQSGLRVMEDRKSKTRHIR